MPGGVIKVKRHEKLEAALGHPDFTICKRFGGEGPVDVGILGWGSTFGEILEAMFAAQDEGIRCSAMKVVMLSPLPTRRIEAFMRHRPRDQYGRHVYRLDDFGMTTEAIDERFEVYRERYHVPFEGRPARRPTS